ncbi:MAG: hypothetical protein ACI9DJ_002245, partial [Algoriphagus sp.]
SEPTILKILDIAGLDNPIFQKANKSDLKSLAL